MRQFSQSCLYTYDFNEEPYCLLNDIEKEKLLQRIISGNSYRSLTIKNYPRLLPEHVKALSNASPTLVELNLEGCSLYFDDSVNNFHFDATFKEFDDRLIPPSELRIKPYLGNGFTDFRESLRPLQQLRILNLAHTNIRVFDLPSSMSESLEYLSVEGCLKLHTLMLKYNGKNKNGRRLRYINLKNTPSLMRYKLGWGYPFYPIPITNCNKEIDACHQSAAIVDAFCLTTGIPYYERRTVMTGGGRMGGPIYDEIYVFNYEGFYIATPLTIAYALACNATEDDFITWFSQQDTAFLFKNNVQDNDDVYESLGYKNTNLAHRVAIRFSDKAVSLFWEKLIDRKLKNYYALKQDSNLETPLHIILSRFDASIGFNIWMSLDSSIRVLLWGMRSKTNESIEDIIKRRFDKSIQQQFLTSFDKPIKQSMRETHIESSYLLSPTDHFECILKGEGDRLENVLESMADKDDINEIDQALESNDVDVFSFTPEGDNALVRALRASITQRVIFADDASLAEYTTLERISPLAAWLVKHTPLRLSLKEMKRLCTRLRLLNIPEEGIKSCRQQLQKTDDCKPSLTNALDTTLTTPLPDLRLFYHYTNQSDIDAFINRWDNLEDNSRETIQYIRLCDIKCTGYFNFNSNPFSRRLLCLLLQALQKKPPVNLEKFELSHMPYLFGTKYNPVSLKVLNEISRTKLMTTIIQLMDTLPQLKTLTLVDVGLEDQHIELLIDYLDKRELPIRSINISDNPAVSIVILEKLDEALNRQQLRAALQGIGRSPAVKDTPLKPMPLKKTILNQAPILTPQTDNANASTVPVTLTHPSPSKPPKKDHSVSLFNLLLTKKPSHLYPNQLIDYVNPAYHYRGDVIVLLWEKFLQQKNCQYFIAKGEVKDTLFGDNAQNATSQQTPSGLVLNADGSLYQCPLNNRTLSIAQAMDSQSVSSAVESAMLALKEAMTQCHTWQTLAGEDAEHYAFLKQHTIVMPYHNGPNHWNFACLDIDWEENTITKAVLTVYEPLHATLELNHLKKRLASNLGIDDIDVIPQCTLQQNDGASCGAISAENGIHYITANKKGWQKQRKMIYKKGARTLREKHLTLIKNKNFTQEQRANRFYRDPVKKFQLQPYADDILVTLEKCLTEHKHFRPMFTAYVRLFLSLHQPHSNALPNDQHSSIIQHTLSTWFRKNRQVLKMYALPEETQLNLFNIFFNDDEAALPWKDDILDDSIDILNRWHEAYGKQLDVQPIIDEVLKATEEATQKAEEVPSLAANQHKQPLQSIASDHSDDKAISHSPINASDNSVVPMSPETESKATHAPIKTDEHLSPVSVSDTSQSWNTLSLCDQIQHKHQWHYPSTDQSISFVTDDQVETTNDAISQAIADYEWLYNTVKAVAIAFDPLPSTEALYQDKDMSDLSLRERLFCIGKELTQRFEDDQADGHENESMRLIPPGDPRLTEDSIIEQLLRLQQRCLKLSSVACFAYADAVDKPPLFQLQTLINGLPKHHRIQMDWQRPEKDPLHVPGLTAAQVIFYKRFTQTLSNMYVVSKVYATKLIKLDSALTRWEKNAQIGKNLVLGAAGFFGGFGHLLHAGTEIIKIKEIETLESYIVEAVELGIQGAVIAGGAAEMLKEGGEVALEIYEQFEGSSDDESEAHESHDARQFSVTSTPTSWRRTSKRLKALNDTVMSVSDFDQKHVQLGLQLAYRYQDQLSRLKPNQVTAFAQACAEHWLEALEMGFLEQTYGQTTNDQFIQYGLQWHAYVKMEKSRAVNVTLKTGQRVSADDLLKKPALKGYYKSNDEANELSEPMTYQWKKGKIQCNPYLKERIVVKQGNGSDVFGTRLASKHEIVVAKKDQTGGQITCWPNVMAIKAKRKPSTIKAEETKFQRMQYQDCPYTEVWALKWRVQMLEKQMALLQESQKDGQAIISELQKEKENLQAQINQLSQKIEANKQSYEKALKDQEIKLREEFDNKLNNKIDDLKKEHHTEITKLNKSLKEKDETIKELKTEQISQAQELKEQREDINELKKLLNFQKPTMDKGNQANNQIVSSPLEKTPIDDMLSIDHHVAANNAPPLLRLDRQSMFTKSFSDLYAHEKKQNIHRQGLPDFKIRGMFSKSLPNLNELNLESQSGDFKNHI